MCSSTPLACRLKPGYLPLSAPGSILPNHTLDQTRIERLQFFDATANRRGHWSIGCHEARLAPMRDLFDLTATLISYMPRPEVGGGTLSGGAVAIRLLQRPAPSYQSSPRVTPCACKFATCSVWQLWMHITRERIRDRGLAHGRLQILGLLCVPQFASSANV
jgi:hypothetical protein